jgi:hypothetical protein
LTAGRLWVSIASMDRDIDFAHFNLPPWGWAAFVLAVAIAAWGYSQSELLLDGINLRYCG